MSSIPSTKRNPLQTFAGARFAVEVVSFLALAHVGAEQVEAGASLAQTGQLDALVDVLEHHADRVQVEADASGAEGVVLRA